jgi:predicted DNA-binding protein with PD1-like motif
LPRRIGESQQSRRILGQLNRGEDLLQGLLSVCQVRGVRCALVAAYGVVDELQLACYDAEGRGMAKPRKLRGAVQLLQAKGILAELDGQLHLELSLVAARQRDNGIEVLGGICSGARVVACEFVIEALEDLIVRRAVDRTTGLPGWQEAFSAAKGAASDAPGETGSTPSAEREPSSPGKLSWADAVMASVRAAPEPEEEEEDDGEPYRPVRVGDFLDHQKFGRCEVQRVDADQEYVTVRLRNSRLVRLNLEVLRLRYTGDEGGRQVFVAAPRAGA